MPPFKVVLVDIDGNNVPAWVGEALAKEGIDFVARECKTSAELARHAGDADVVWNWGSRIITAESLAALPKCGGIIRTGSGTDNIPVEAATQRGIVVANTPQAHHDAVSDHAIGLLFAVMRQIPARDRDVRSGKWNVARPWPGWHLHGQTLGLVGFGHVARLVAKKMRGFELTVLAHDPYVSAEAMINASVRAASLEAVLSASDFLFLHCPLTQETFHLIGERELRQMKPAAILINTARGSVVDEPALVRALTEGWIAAAGLDVLEQEPPALDHPLFKLNNVVLTPHIAGHTDEDLELCFRLSVEAAIAMAHGRWPRSYVNRGVKPRMNLSE
jgi:D-3-phosphoglycerate dehydrogenase